MLIIAVMILLLIIFLFLIPELVIPPGSIAGQITGNGPVSGAEVYLSKEGFPPQPSDRATATGPDGRYSFSDVEPGNYNVRVSRINNLDGTYYNPKTVSCTVVAAKESVVDMTLER